jgi:hypothetical protein
VISDTQKFVVPVPALKDGGEPLIYPGGSETEGDPILDRRGDPIGEKGIVFWNAADQAWQAASGDGTAVIIINQVNEENARELHRRLLDLGGPTRTTLESLKELLEFAVSLGLGDMYNSDREYVDAYLSPVMKNKLQVKSDDVTMGFVKRDDRDTAWAVYVDEPFEFVGSKGLSQLMPHGGAIVRFGTDIHGVQPDVFRATYRLAEDGRPIGELAAEIGRRGAEAPPILPSGQVIPLHTLLEQSADHERIVITIKKLRDKCPSIAERDLQELKSRLTQALYMRGLTPEQWHREARGIAGEVIEAPAEDVAKRINQALFVSSRYHFAEAPQPEILAHFEAGEEIHDAIESAQTAAGDHTIEDVSLYLHNRLGATLIGLMKDLAVAIEVFIGSRDDMVAFFRSKNPPLSLIGELDSPTSTEFYLFEDATSAPTVVIGGITNRSRLYHQFWQLKYAGVDLRRIVVHGTFDSALGPQVEALRRELDGLPVSPTIAVIGQRWLPMEVLGKMTGAGGDEGAAYEALQPTNFEIGSFCFDYLIASAAGAPANRNKIGVVTFRMPNGSLAGEAIRALVDSGTTHVMLAGAGGALSRAADVGSYQVFTEATYGAEEYAIGDSCVFVPKLPADLPWAKGQRNITVDSPLEESTPWLERTLGAGYTIVDVESAHLLASLSAAANRDVPMRITPGLFVSDVVGGKGESLTEKISGENAYFHAERLLEAYFIQVGVSGVYDAGGTHRPFKADDIESSPALIQAAQAIRDVTRHAILGVRCEVDDFHILSAPKKKVDYPDFQSMGGHKQILYIIPPSSGSLPDLQAFLEGSDPDKLFLLFPATVDHRVLELATEAGYETIIIVAPDNPPRLHAAYLIASDSGWGTYETIVAANAHALAVCGDPKEYRAVLVAMENKDKTVFVSAEWESAPVVQELDAYIMFEAGGLAAEVEKALKLRKLEAWVAKVRPEIEIVPLGGIREFAAGRKIIGVSGSSKIAQFDPASTEAAFVELLSALNPQEVMFGTGATDYGVEEILHRLIRERFRGYSLLGFITNEGRGDELGTPAVTAAGIDWFGKSVPFLNAVDFFITVAGGSVIQQELLMAHKAGIPLFPLAGSGMKTDEFLESHTSLPRYYDGRDIASAITQELRAPASVASTRAAQ